MPSKSKKPQKGPMPLKLEVSFEGQPEDDIQVEAYAFDRGGRFLGSAKVAKGTATLALTDEEAPRARLFFAPPLIEERPQVTPSIEMMGRLNAYEAVWEFDPGRSTHPINPLPEILWRGWLWCSCRVRGQVVRPVEAGGTVQNLPVCHARVHICEVDRWPWLIARLPEKRIFRLRNELLQELQNPTPWKRPLPDPPPFQFDPGVIDPSPENLARMVQSDASRTISDLDAVGGRTLQLQPPSLEIEARVSQQASLEVASISALSSTTQASLVSGSATVVRQALIDNVHLILPYLCYWPWIWGWFRCDEQAVLETDAQGRFDTTIWYPCFGDKPDLYFWVEACIGGSWETVHRPPIGCNTRWNYLCGSEVTLTVTDPRVAVCNEPPDLGELQVAIMSIGNNVSMSEIAASGLTTSGQPFGGTLEPHVWFSRSALIAAGVTHYKWSYRRQTDAAGNSVADTWHAMDRSVIRHYALTEETPPDFPLTFPAYPLGPDPAMPVLNLFKIQPITVPVTPPANFTITGWSALPQDAREDSASAFFQSHLLSGGDPAAAAGRYQLKFELYDDAGNLVNFTDRGILLKEATSPAPIGTGTATTTVAPNVHRVLDGTGDTVGFQISVWVDNNPCQAWIDSVSGPGLDVDADCGFVEYEAGASATIEFRAHHPNDHASFQFETYRGPSIKVPEASAPAVGSSNVGLLPVNGFVPNAARVYSKSVPVSTLLTSGKPAGSPDCESAAFSETLYVWAKATDGWSRLSHLDARGTPKAFALAPKP